MTAVPFLEFVYAADIHDCFILGFFKKYNMIFIAAVEIVLHDFEIRSWKIVRAHNPRFLGQAPQRDFIVLQSLENNLPGRIKIHKINFLGGKQGIHFDGRDLFVGRNATPQEEQ